MTLSSRQAKALLAITCELAGAPGSVELRRSVGGRLLELLDADHLASYVWSPARGRFTSRVALNMSEDNLARYESYFQFHDPITPRLQRRTGATHVGEVLSTRALVRTEFYTDFLARDGLHHGLNYFAWADGENLGDLRVWRGRHREPFDEAERALLDRVGTAFTSALRRARTLEEVRGGGALTGLTAREAQVARAVADGDSDREAARRLGMSFGTLRTHLAHVFAKTGARNRTDLAARLRGALPPG